jgi:hypothetical protein
MPKPSRKLLVLAALCWVAPVSAQQHPVSGSWQHHRAGCPHARASAWAAAANQSSASPAVVVGDSPAAEGSLFYIARHPLAVSP